MFTIKYIASLWKRKIPGQLLSFVYAIPVTLILLCSLAQMFAPITANLLFEKNAGYRYVYSTAYSEYSENQEGGIPISKGAEKLNKESQAIKALYTDNKYIRSGYNEKLSKNDTAYYDQTSIAKLFVMQAGADFSGTFFTDDNFTDQDTPGRTQYAGKPQIYLSYNTAKYLKAQKGDTVLVEFIGRETTYVNCIVSGFMKPLYDGTSEGNTPTEYNKYMAFPSLMIVDQALYEQIAAGDPTILLKAFSSHKIDLDGADSVAVNTRDEILSDLKSTLKQKEIFNRFLLQIVFSLITSMILLTIEFNFTRKKNMKDMEILGMLGMRKNDMKRILSIQVFISYLVTLILSGLICIYIYFDLFLHMYCEPVLIITITAGLLLAGVIFILLRALFVQKTI